MRFFISISMIVISTITFAQQTMTINVSNPSNSPRTDQPVVIPLQQHNNIHSALVTVSSTGQEIPCQLDDLDQDEVFDELCFLVNLDKKEKNKYTVTLFEEGKPREYNARVYAEMLMRNDKVKEKNRHNNYIESITARGDCAYSYNLQHHHGVDFESELNGIRIYFDNRQTLDLYGKFKKRLELKETQFYTSEEQKIQGYGDDVLWVGQTFGLGAFRGWNGKEPTLIDPVRSRTQRIISYGPLRTIVEVIDRGWEAPFPGKATTQPLHMTQRYIQYAGHRDTDVEIFFNRNVNQYQFSTGIINVKNSQEFSDKKGLRACWGTDYPSTDTIKWNRETVGLAICIPQKHIISEEPANKDNYAFVVGTQQNKICYKIAYSSANEEFGYHSANEWFNFLKEWKKEIENPIRIDILH
ncbi:MAG: DUF4861 domain-containing protein [Prevotella sp.]|nr:DUF4861 domain-containing protein [Prevotella sp.]